MAFAEGFQQGTSNDTTDVTMVSAPGSSTVRAVTGFTVYNTDTAAATVTIKFDNTSVERIIFKGTLAAGDQLYWGREDSPIYLTTTSDTLEIVLGGAVTTNQLQFTANYADIS